MKVFNRYSEYYDLLYEDKEYEGEVQYIHELIHAYMPKAKTILDLGCGTGRHDFFLAQQGYKIDGVDFSKSMIDIALKKKELEYKDSSSDLSFSIGDVRSVRTEKKYDVVVSLFHVMSYQTKNIDLQAAFQTAKVHLKKGGLFIFDYWYGPGVLTDPPSVRVKRLENENIHVTRIAEPIVHPNDNCVDVNYSIFIKDKHTKIVEELTETHKMRYLFLSEIEEISDFTLLNSYEWRKTEPLRISSWNGITILKKI